MKQKGFINILLIVLVVASIGTGIYVVSTRQTLPPVPNPSPIPSPTPTPTPTPRPDPIPKPSPTSTPSPIPSDEKIIRKVGERVSSFLIQKINSTSVDGLWFQAYPIERPNDPGTPKTLYIGDDMGYACEGVSIKLISINFVGQTITS